MDIECHRNKEVFSRFHSLWTPNSALKELKSKWEWYKAIDVVTQSLDVVKEIPKCKSPRSNLFFSLFRSSSTIFFSSY